MANVIHRVALTKFKKFAQTEIELKPYGVTFLAGGNNSGKSTLLQAIAVWSFCQVVLSMERGRASLLPGYTRQGLGLSDDEFSPVAIASLKHLWTNLKTQSSGEDSGYILKIRCDWNDENNDEKFLRVALALANDRLFIKVDETNLLEDDKIPPIAYLPPFAGISSRENLMSGGERRAMIGKGLAGGVIRNTLYDLFIANVAKREELKSGRTKIKNSDLEKLRREDPWEILQSTLANTFSTTLDVASYNQQYHTSIKINTVKGTVESGRFVRHTNYTPRDLMAEGSGFLQWLSVYALALNDAGGTILLDEPDAHLHPSLQGQLVQALEEIALAKNKQALLATHSTEMLRYAEFESILRFKGMGAKYLKSQQEKVPLFLGLGSDYAPKIDPLRRKCRMLMVENHSDERVLKVLCGKIGRVWPTNLVAWPWPVGGKERKQLFNQLKAEVPALRAISIVDRYDLELDQVDSQTLRDKSYGLDSEDFKLRVWRRRHIENYLLSPQAISRASGASPDNVGEFFATQGLIVPENFTSRNVVAAMLDARGKELVQGSENSIKTSFNLSPIDIAQAMNADEVCEDIRELLDQIEAICTIAEV